MPQILNQTKASPLWYSGVCDELYIKIAMWEHAYWNGGEIHSTREWLDPNSGQVVPKPTRMAHRVPLREVDLEHLIRIVGALKPDSEMLAELTEIKVMWKYAKPVHGYRYTHGYWSALILPKGIHRSITLAFYPEHVKELMELLKEAKTGQKTLSIQQQIDQKKSEGKDIFEQ